MKMSSLKLHSAPLMIHLIKCPPHLLCCLYSSEGCITFITCCLTFPFYTRENVKHVSYKSKIYLTLVKMLKTSCLYSAMGMWASASLTPPQKALLAPDWLNPPHAARIQTNEKPRGRHVTACFRKSRHGPVWNVERIWWVWNAIERVSVRRRGDGFTFLPSDMRLHVIIAAVCWCGLVDSRKIRGISSSCEFSVPPPSCC